MRHERPPTEMTMREVKDFPTWREANLDAPVGVDPTVYEAIRSKPGAHPDDLLDIPGVRVKGCYDGKGYQVLGKLVKCGGANLRWQTSSKAPRLITDEVVVLSTLDKETVWFGTREQYHAMWCVD